MKKTTKKHSDSDVALIAEEHRFWAANALNQVGYIINLIFTLSVAFVVFVLNECSECQSMEDSILICGVSAKTTVKVLAMLSVLIGGVTIYNRLIDIRITRHIYHIRDWVSREKGYSLPVGHIPVENKGIIDVIKCYLGSIPWITKIEKKKQVLKSFFELSEINILLGKYTYKLLRSQAIIFFLSVILYGALSFK